MANGQVVIKSLKDEPSLASWNARSGCDEWNCAGKQWNKCHGG